MLHIHTKVFTNWAPQPSRTFKAGHLAYTGQCFFNDDVSETINKVTSTPSATHTAACATGMTDSTSSTTPMWHYDPVVKLEKLGVIIDQGLVGFITMGINASAAYDLV
ncbi:hypothetical protein FIBSPDRAFT_964900 [Athelia psychrophila]|uniref:Uncharacterized protein n=1 Tax=Athelia psychrophila TaxID=1759441 RepID=A0A165X780_9AGAM|nr:hypothetical protein FIBSPDRAFT_964900 [Fibularhizoctonia sp. CBS 109695]